MKSNAQQKENTAEFNGETKSRVYILLHSRLNSRYSLFQYLLLSIWPLAMFLFIGFQERYVYVVKIIARIVVILYILIILILYLVNKKHDVLYMIIAYVVEFPIILLLAYFNQMIVLLVLKALGLLPWFLLKQINFHFSSSKESKHISSTIENKNS